MTTNETAHPSGPRRLTYDVRFWKIRVRPGKRKTMYAIRWTVAGQEFHKTFATKAHADSRLAELRTAARTGQAFDAATGLPVSEVDQREERTWYDHVSTYVERRWPRIGGGQRRSIADAIATATPALLTTGRGQPGLEIIRSAMYAWASNMSRRRDGEPPAHIAAALSWLQHNTAPISALADQPVLDTVLDLLARRLDGTAAAPNTISRRRSVLSSILGFAVDDGLLDVQPAGPQPLDRT